jgi:hypothetical protein
MFDALMNNPIQTHVSYRIIKENQENTIVVFESNDIKKKWKSFFSTLIIPAFLLFLGYLSDIPNKSYFEIIVYTFNLVYFVCGLILFWANSNHYFYDKCQVSELQNCKELAKSPLENIAILFGLGDAHYEIDSISQNSYNTPKQKMSLSNLNSV